MFDYMPNCQIMVVLNADMCRQCAYDTFSLVTVQSRSGIMVTCLTAVSEISLQPLWHATLGMGCTPKCSA